MANQLGLLKRYFLFTIIAVFIISGVAAGLAYVVGSNTYSYKFLWTLGAVFIYGVLSIFSLRLSTQKDVSKYFSYISLFFATLGFIISMLLVWEVFTGASEVVFKTLSISLLITVYLSILGLVSGKMNNKVTKYAFLTTLLIIVLNSVFFSYLIIGDVFNNSDVSLRIFWALNILILVGVVTTPISRRL